MKIIVLADTHIPERAQDLPEQIYDDLKDADLILHAGDIISLDFLKKLEKIGKIKAVQGNMDEPALKDRLPLREVIKIGKYVICLTHGRGSPFNLMEQVHNEFLKEKPSIIIFGHSHKPLNTRKDDILFFNPGSPTDKIFSDTNSYGIITIGDSLEAKIVRL